MTVSPLGADGRGVSPVVGVILLVAIAVVLATVTATLVTGAGDDLHESPRLAVRVEETTITEGEDCPTASVEVAVDVTLTRFHRADAVYVVADGGVTKDVWSDPGSDTVGATRRVANEALGNGGVDVDVGGGGDTAICPGDRETFRFFARYDGQTLLLRKHTTG
ncbi:MAG: type IV pilin [Haloferacaceae archaeon]